MYFIDSTMGAAGDMLVGAFIDLDILDREKVRRILEKAGNAMGPTSVELVHHEISGIEGGATGLNIQHHEYSHVSGRKMQKFMNKGADAIGLKRGKDWAMKTLNAILIAEVKVHDSTMDEIHLHETGSPDTLVDILGMAYFYEKLKLYEHRIHGTPISVGRGKVKIAHGIVDVPAPATAEILQTMDYEFGPHDGEMATPTGVAILSSLLQVQVREQDLDSTLARVQIDGVTHSPTISGAGAGTKEFGGSKGCLWVHKMDDTDDY